MSTLIGLIALFFLGFWCGRPPTSVSRAPSTPPVSTIPTVPHTVLVYRTSTHVMHLDLAPLGSPEDLLVAAQRAFREPLLTRVLSLYGEPMTKERWTATQDRRVFVLRDDEPYMFPAFQVGDVVRMNVNGREIQVTTLSVVPRVFELDNFLAPDECAHMIERAKREKMVDSTVGSETKLSSKSQLRTSEQAWIGPGQKNDDDIFAGVRARVLNLTRLDESLAEDTQLVHYRPGTHYYAHHDYSAPYASNPYYAAGGNRLLTVLYYLNDVAHGGETRFPYANNSHPRSVSLDTGRAGAEFCHDDAQGLRIQPRRGRAVLFYNLIEEERAQGVGAPETLHVGCDPTHGEEKWLCNMWVRNKRVKINGQMHLYDSFW